jgi:hypothetical protein
VKFEEVMRKRAACILSRMYGGPQAAHLLLNTFAAASQQLSDDDQHEVARDSQSPK